MESPKSKLVLSLITFISCLFLCVACGDSEESTALEDELPEVGESFDKACYSCHGNSLSPAPPRALGGIRESSSRGVGATVAISVAYQHGITK